MVSTTRWVDQIVGIKTLQIPTRPPWFCWIATLWNCDVTCSWVLKVWMPILYLCLPVYLHFSIFLPWFGMAKYPSLDLRSHAPTWVIIPSHYRQQSTKQQIPRCFEPNSKGMRIWSHYQPALFKMGRPNASFMVFHSNGTIENSVLFCTKSCCTARWNMTLSSCVSLWEKCGETGNVTFLFWSGFPSGDSSLSRSFQLRPKNLTSSTRCPV